MSGGGSTRSPENDEIVRRYNNGESKRDLAKEFGLSKDAITGRIVRHPDYRPTQTTGKWLPDDGIVDPVAVLRATEGDPGRMTRSEATEAVRILHGRGLPDIEIGRMTGMEESTAAKLRRELRLPANRQRNGEITGYTLAKQVFGIDSSGRYTKKNPRGRRAFVSNAIIPKGVTA